MAKTRFDHVALLVRNLEQSVADFRDVLNVVDSENSLEIVWDSDSENGYVYRAATFVSKNGGAVVQLLESEHPKDKERLVTKGEGVHHLEFCTDEVETISSELKSKGVPLLSENPTRSETHPWQESVVVSPQKTHGVLVKVTTSYSVQNSQWVPRPRR